MTNRYHFDKSMDVAREIAHGATAKDTTEEEREALYKKMDKTLKAVMHLEYVRNSRERAAILKAKADDERLAKKLRREFGMEIAIATQQLQEEA